MAQRNQFRIIGGEWRGRRLNFSPAPGLRPTPDRVRETLFNWLMPVIEGARVLDLFAGSGALGFEAASRGAARVVMVDNHPDVVAQLQSNARLLGTERIEVQRAEARQYLGRPAQQGFEVVFLDPPYQSGVLQPCLAALHGGGWLSPGALLYLEHDSHDPPPLLPAGWQWYRSKTAGQVAYHLARSGPAGS